MKTPEPALQHYVDEERDARLRLARYKAKLYASPQLASPAASLRMRELQRRWDGAVTRLREAKAREKARPPSG
jgi:hypothetical protein